MKNAKSNAPKLKITKKQVDAVLAQGITHANFTNKSVQRRLMKNQAKVARAQQLRENQSKRLQKAKKAAESTKPVGGYPTGSFVGADGKVIPPEEMAADMEMLKDLAQLGTLSDVAHFIDKDGNKVPVSVEKAEELIKAFEAAPENSKIDIDSVPSSYGQQHDMDTAGFEHSKDFGVDTANPEAVRAHIFDNGVNEMYPPTGKLENFGILATLNDRPDHPMDPILAGAKEHCPASDMSENETMRTIHGDGYSYGINVNLGFTEMPAPSEDTPVVGEDGIVLPTTFQEYKFRKFDASNINPDNIPKNLCPEVPYVPYEPNRIFTELTNEGIGLSPFGYEGTPSRKQMFASNIPAATDGGTADLVESTPRRAIEEILRDASLQVVRDDAGNPVSVDIVSGETGATGKIVGIIGEGDPGFEEAQAQSQARLLNDALGEVAPQKIQNASISGSHAGGGLVDTDVKETEKMFQEHQQGFPNVEEQSPALKKGEEADE